jgi:integrase/recombinase XerD
MEETNHGSSKNVCRSRQHRQSDQGRDEHRPEGRYYLDWYEDGRKRRQTAPPFEELLAAARAKFIELQARKAGILVELPKPQTRLRNRSTTADVSSSAPDPNRLTMAAAIDQYLEFCEKQRSLRTFRTYRSALKNYFLNSYVKTYGVRQSTGRI